MNEFKLAMANLAANNASGVASRVGSFAYFGAGTGTSPLPIYLAYLNGSRDAGNPAAYANAATTWANADHRRPAGRRRTRIPTRSARPISTAT